MSSIKRKKPRKVSIAYYSSQLCFFFAFCVHSSKSIDIHVSLTLIKQLRITFLWSRIEMI